MAAETNIRKTTQDEFDSLSSTFALDMIALFANMEDDVMKLIDRSKREGWTPDKLIDEIVGLV